MQYGDSAFRSCPYCLSQALWILYFILPLAATFIFPYKNGGQTIQSATSPAWDSSIDPLIFSHVTDVHVSEIDDSIPVIQRLFDSVNTYFPEFVLLTGDLSDDYDRHMAPRFGDQVTAFWQDYKRLVDTVKCPVFDLGGNHDMWGIRSVDSPKNSILDYSVAHKRNETFSVDDFLVKVVPYGAYNIVLVNPFQFPTPRPPMLMWMCPATKILDLIEKAVNDHENVLLATHYPVDMWCTKKSSKGHTFADVIENPHVIAHFTGHTHPKVPQFEHIGKTGALEIVGPAGFQRKKYGIVSIDNGKLAWTTIEFETETEPKVIITHPIPKTQVTPRENFADPDTEVRLVAFTDKELDIKVYGDVYGTMVRQRKLANGGWLYSHPLNLSRVLGDHEVHFAGDFEGSVEFTLAHSYTQVKEMGSAFPRSISWLFYLLPPFFLVLLLIVIPAQCLSLDSVEDWIEGKSDESNWWICIFGGFLMVRTRFLRLPTPLQWVFLVFICWPLALPTSFIHAEGAFGMVWTYGYIIDLKVLPAYYGWFFSFFYLAIVMTWIIFACGMVVENRSTASKVLDHIMAVIGTIVQLVVAIRLVCETTGYWLVWISPAFVLIPIVMYTLTLYYAYCAKKSISSDLAAPLIDLND